MHVAAATNELSCLNCQTTMTDDIRDRNMPCNAAAYQLVEVSSLYYDDATTELTDGAQRYGPVVRVGANRVAFRNIDAVKTIYTTHRFRKSNWWNALTFGGEQNMLSARCVVSEPLSRCLMIDVLLTCSDPGYHALCRRLSAPAFRGDNIRAAGDVLVQEMDNLVGRLRRDCADGSSVDVLKLFQMLSLDMFVVPSSRPLIVLTSPNQSRSHHSRRTLQSNRDRERDGLREGMLR